MKVVLFCGGQGTRIREYSQKIPKPMIPLRGRPILWHIMKYYAEYGHTDFVLCLGYKAEKIINYFSKRKFDDWNITFVDSGINATIGDRLLSAKPYVENEPMFLANYGDAVSDVPLNEVIGLSMRNRKSPCTLVGVRPHISYHMIKTTPGGTVTGVTPTIEGWINGGFFVMRPSIFEVLNPGEEIVVEGFERMIPKKLLMTYKYDGFWRSMDTMKDRDMLEEMCKHEAIAAPWEIWMKEPATKHVGETVDAQPVA